MKRTTVFRLALATVAGLALVANPANATVVDNTSLVSPGVYFGTGNSATNQHWTVDTENGVEAGVTTIQRGVGANITPSGNVYVVPLGADPTNAARAYWNFDFSVNLTGSGMTLGDVNILLTVQNLGNGTSMSGDPMALFSDNSAIAVGGATRNGNVSGQQATLVDIGEQNSENLVFGQFASLLFNMNIDDTYHIDLSVTDKLGNSLANVDEYVQAGAGATPLPGALPLFAGGLGVVGLLLGRRKNRPAPNVLGSRNSA